MEFTQPPTDHPFDGYEPDLPVKRGVPKTAKVFSSEHRKGGGEPTFGISEIPQFEPVSESKANSFDWNLNGKITEVDHFDSSTHYKPHRSDPFESGLQSRSTSAKDDGRAAITEVDPREAQRMMLVELITNPVAYPAHEPLNGSLTEVDYAEHYCKAAWQQSRKLERNVHKTDEMIY